MRAIFCTAYGPPEVLQLREVEKPIPKDNELLIRIRATTVSAADCELRRFDFPGWVWLPMRMWFGLSRPRIPVLGQELAGDVESAGKDVKSFAPGDRVFAATGVGLGAHAEYICLREAPAGGALTRMPADMSYEEAAAVPYGGGEALQFLRKANIGTGQKVLVNGAGGSFGTFAVQLARLFGAEVTAVDSAGKLDMLRSIGADHVVDYTQQSFTERGETYDVIFDVVGKSPFSRSVRSLRENGRYLLANPELSHLVRGLWSSMTSHKKVIFGASSGTSEDLAYLRELIEAGKLRSVIDRSYPLERMAEAHRYVETGQKIGNVAITVAHDN
jgi:NADPH:quinone reductase-like Zn-dependent oxidoreductase